MQTKQNQNKNIQQRKTRQNIKQCKKGHKIQKLHPKQNANKTTQNQNKNNTKQVTKNKQTMQNKTKQNTNQNKNNTKQKASNKAKQKQNTKQKKHFWIKVKLKIFEKQKLGKVYNLINVFIYFENAIGWIFLYLVTMRHFYLRLKCPNTLCSRCILQPVVAHWKFAESSIESGPKMHLHWHHNVIAHFPRCTNSPLI